MFMQVEAKAGADEEYLMTHLFWAKIQNNSTPSRHR